MSSEKATNYVKITRALPVEEFEELLRTRIMIYVEPYCENFAMTSTFIRLARSGEMKAHVIWATWVIGKVCDKSTEAFNLPHEEIIAMGLAPFNEEDVNKQFHLHGFVFFECEGEINTKFPIKCLMCYSGWNILNCPPLETLITLDGIILEEVLGKHRDSLKKLIVSEEGFGNLQDVLYVQNFPNLEEIWAPMDSVWIKNCPKLRYVNACGFRCEDESCPSLEVLKCETMYEIDMVSEKDPDFKNTFPNLKQIYFPDETILTPYMIEECLKSKIDVILEPYDFTAEFKKARGFNLDPYMLYN